MADIAYFYRETPTLHFHKGEDPKRVIREGIVDLLSSVAEAMWHNSFCFIEGRKLNLDADFKWRLPITVTVRMLQDGISCKLEAEVSAEGEWKSG